MSNKRIIVITSENSYAVGNLFVGALKSLGHEVERFDLFKALAAYEKGGWVGKKVNRFWPVEAWTRKANRELAVFIQRFKPDYILISGDNPVQVGALAFARSILPNLKVILFWPDTLVNLSFSITQLSPVIDTLASYSSTAIEQFKLMGFRHCIWMPFAGDVAFLGDESQKVLPGHYAYDCSFVGGWRPEREMVLERISTSMPDISLRIIGPLWSKNVRNKQLIKYIEDTPRYGKEFGAFIRSSRINLNIIDDTNYPAANMRFFEIPAAGGLQLSSACPEMEKVFIAEEHIFYYSHPDAVADKIRYILSNPEMADRVRLQGHHYVRDHHTYSDRMKSIV